MKTPCQLRRFTLNTRELPFFLRVLPQSRHLLAYPYRQAARRRSVVHVVNYDYDLRDDMLRPQQNITISIRAIPRAKPSQTVTLRGWEFGRSLELPLVENEGYWTFTLPRLTYSAAAVVTLQRIESNKRLKTKSE